MKLFVSQFYIEPGVSYPFSVHFQRFMWPRKELTKRIVDSDEFVRRFGKDFDLMFRMSAKAGIVAPEVRGPTVFKKDKSVEFTVFLTFDRAEQRGQDAYCRALKQLMVEITGILRSLRLDASQLVQDCDQIIERIIANPKMIEQS